MEPKGKFLRRYTNLADAIHILRTGQLTLRDPSRWDDKNDWHFMKMYQKSIGAKSLSALCFTSSEETYHHWRIYSNGYDGVCFRLNHEEFVRSAQRSLQGLRADFVKYKYTKAVKANRPKANEWPFLKRAAFAGECEFRLVYAQRTDKASTGPIIPLEPEAIDRIILSPWLHKSLINSLRQTLKDVAENSDLEVYQSRLIDYKPWQSIADEDVEALA
jgi:hypothetical protein